jgi:hypothetical protein
MSVMDLTWPICGCEKKDIKEKKVWPWTPGFPDMWGPGRRKHDAGKFYIPTNIVEPKQKRTKKRLPYNEVPNSFCDYCKKWSKDVRTTYLWIGYGRVKKWETTITFLCEDCRKALNGRFKYCKG